MRAIAVAAVFLYHADASWLPGGFLGVDLFFVLSGFLVTRLLLNELRSDQRLDLRAFYLRRARRLLPAAFVFIVAVLLGAALAWPDTAAETRDDSIAAVAYVTNWWFITRHQSYMAAVGRPPLLQHLWSLAVEEQFYILWPAVVLAAARCAQNYRWCVAWIAGLGALASTAWMAWLAVRGNIPYDTDASRLYFGTDTHAAGLLVGGLAAAAVAGRTRKPITERTRLVFDVLAMSGVGALALEMHEINEFRPGLYRGGFLGIAALCAAVIVAVSCQRSLLARFLDLPPLRWLGTRSYSVYLWHWPVIDVTRPGLDVHWPAWLLLAVRTAVTAVLAEISFRVVEEPFRRGRVQAWLAQRSTRQRATRHIAIAAGVTLALLSWGLAGRRQGSSSLEAAPGRLEAGPSRLTASSRPPEDSVTEQPHRARHTDGRDRVRRTAVTAVGDSVLLGAAPQLQHLVPGIHIDAAVGRQAPAAFSELADLQRAGQLGHDVIIETGDNGIVSKSELDTALDRLGDRRVVLVNDYVPRPWERPNDATFRSVAATRPNVVLLDWQAAAGQHPSWLWSDGIHLRDAGANAYAGLIARALVP